MKNLLIIIPVVILFYSCKSKSALNFSETIVKKEKSLEADIVSTENKVKNFLAAGAFDSMAAVSKKMESLVTTKLNEIKFLEAPDVQLAENFKKDAIDYFAYMKNVYNSYVKFANAKTDELRQQELLNLQELVNKKDDVLRNMRNSQKKFAEANGFKVE